MPVVKKLAGGANNRSLTPIPARVVTIKIVSHTRPTNVRYCRMRPTITSDTPKGPDVNMLKGDAIVVNLREGLRSGAEFLASGDLWDDHCVPRSLRNPARGKETGGSPNLNLTGAAGPALRPALHHGRCIACK